MKPSIHTAVLVLTLLSAMAPGLARSADNPLYEQAQQLQSSRQAPQFSIGSTTYQLLPQARVVPGEQAKDASDAPAVRGVASTPVAVSRIGPYAIVMPGNDGAPGTRANTAAAATDGYGVAVNMKTGLPVLLLPQLQLQVSEAGHGQALAQALGGTLLFDGPTSLLVVVGFDSVAAALQALPQARTLDKVTHAQPSVQRRFRKLR